MASLTLPQINDLLTRPAVQQYLKKRFYDWAEERAGGKRLNWPALSKEVESYTGSLIPTDTLRVQFEPVSKKAGKPPRQGFRDKRHWLTLFEFLTSEAVNYVQIKVLQHLDEPVGPFSELLSRFADQQVDSALYYGRFVNTFSIDAISDNEIVLDIVKANSSGLAKAVFTLSTDSKPGFAASVQIWKGILINLGEIVFMLLRQTDDKLSKVLVVYATTSTSVEVDHLALLVLDKSVGGLTARSNSTPLAKEDEVLIGYRYKLESNPALLCLTREGIKSKSTRTRRNFAGNEVIRELMKENSMIDGRSDEQQLIRYLLEADLRALELIPIVKNINFIDKEIGKAALHIAAVKLMPEMLEALWQRKDLDVLLLDLDGHSASDLAWLEAGDQMLGMKIVKKEAAEKRRRKRSESPEPS